MQVRFKELDGLITGVRSEPGGRGQLIDVMHQSKVLSLILYVVSRVIKDVNDG